MSTGKISKRVEKELHQKKVVIRRLPPDFTEEKFLQTINPLPINTYFYFAPGDSSLGPHGCSRAYIAFENEQEIVPFRDQYDGLVLESERGTKYRVTVEYAPSQCTPRKLKKKIDARTGTIEQDSDYKIFLEAYEAKTDAAPVIDLSVYLEEVEAKKARGVQSTPLTEYLQDRRVSRSRRSRSAAELKKKQKGVESSRSKGRGSRDKLEDDSSSKAASDESRRGKRKDRDRQDKGTRDSDSATKGAAAVDQVEEKGNKTDSLTATQSSKDRRGDTFHSRNQSSESKGRPESRDRYRDKGESRTRNRDRPDKAIYTPRGQGRDETSSGASGGTGEKGYGKSKEDGGYSQSRSQRSRGRRGDGEYHPRDRDEKYSRDRGRGPRGDRQKERNESGQGSKNDTHSSYRAT